MAKIERKTWGYIIPTLLLIAGAFFLFYKSNVATGGFASGGYKSYGYFSHNGSGEDLDIKTIRWHQHKGYERLVFDIYEWDGVFGENPYQRSNFTGVYQIGTEKKGTLFLDGEVSGYRAFSADMPSFSKSKIIKKMEVYSNDDGSFLFSVKLKRAAAYKVFTLKNPARIIIDIK